MFRALQVKFGRLVPDPLDTTALTAQADAARDVGHYAAAAAAYTKALQHSPNNAAIHIQCGHMLKETGDLDGAERHYLAAKALTPNDPDLALQLGHFYKVAQRWVAAEAAYTHAATLTPGWAEPARELAWLWTRTDGGTSAYVAAQAAALGLSGRLSQLVPELAPREPAELVRRFADRIRMLRLGTPARSQWGNLPSVRGVEALRGTCIASTPLADLQVVLDGQLIHSEPLKASPAPIAGGRQTKYVFNIWFDFSPIAAGRHDIEFRFTGPGNAIRAHRDQVVVAPPLTSADIPGCDGITDGSSGAPGLEALINARPSVVRPATRRLFPEPPRRILAMRTDQLGDMVTSIPAVRRLRALFPAAQLVGLLTAGNAEFARTLGLFDDVVVADFPDVDAERRRIMPLATQAALRTQLAGYDFDLAIDLAESAVSRPLLLLSGARFLYGFGGGDWPWLDATFEGNTYDPRNRREIKQQSQKVLALIENLATAFAPAPDTIRRNGLDPAIPTQLGLKGAARYAVLHTGARIQFSRWPYYAELAALLIQRTALDVIILTDDPATRATLPPDLAANPRFHLVDQLLPFDHFDALLSFCAVFVGNDSGPKHLAALRGAPVVSVHSARINWNDWGQEHAGFIVSRRVPCAGCLIFHDTDECGKDFACIRHIAPEEVFGAVAQLLQTASPT